jgi:alkylation response protein AidB-like acyl-CoA dehydrogenase
MSQEEGNRNNPYSFDDYLLVRNMFDFYQDDEFLQALVKKYTGEQFENIHKELLELSKQISFKFRDLADQANTLENRAMVTHVQHYDAHNHRIDRINRCAETETLEREIFDLGLFDLERNTAWSRFCKLFLLASNGEFGIMCPIACTHGMVALMQKYETEEPRLLSEALNILHHARNGKDPNISLIKRNYAVCAQFISEIQGGSDVPSNLIEAEYEENAHADGISNCWRLYGQKFFCSAMQAEYSVVTAKPKNSESSTKIAAFVVPSWLPGNRDKQTRNSYTIDRLKPKLGTAELPTAEITYNGAVAYPIGPLDKGLSNVVGIVLTISRLHVALGEAAQALRVAREATLYAQFRQAFGASVASFPLMMVQISKLNNWAMRTAAGNFKIYAEYVALGESLVSGIGDLETIKDLEDRKRRFRFREIVMLQKIAVADETPQMIRLAISFFGGHGIMEDFLSLPRFMRDSMIMELWEGPRNVLLTQIHRDVQKVKSWYPADQLVRDLLENESELVVEDLALSFKKIIDHKTLLTSDEATLSICEEWQKLSNDIMIAFQNLALKELGCEIKLPKFSQLLRKFKKQIKP